MIRSAWGEVDLIPVLQYLGALHSWTVASSLRWPGKMLKGMSMESQARRKKMAALYLNRIPVYSRMAVGPFQMFRLAVLLGKSAMKSEGSFLGSGAVLAAGVWSVSMWTSGSVLRL
jgi:hypothetical protein